MRRVSIGVELVAAPDVLVLDEPTSGLDSVSAARLVKLLKVLTEGPNKTTIIASIHQPSSALYHSFNQVVLLSQGRQLYFGPGGAKPAEWFASQGRPCPPGYNVADHLLEIASGPTDGLPTGQAAVADLNPPTNETSAPSTSSASDNIEKLTSYRDTTPDQSDTPFVEKPDHVVYPPQTLPKHGEQGQTDLSNLCEGGHTRHKESKLWPRSECATTFLTQIEVLSGREWRNLRR